MRIAIATGPFHPTPPGPAGAVERLTADLAARFAAKGHEVTLISRRHPGLPDKEVVAGVRHLRLRGSQSTIRVWVNILKDFPYSFSAALHLPPADIWLLNSFWLPVLAPLRRRAAGARIVVAAHRYPKGQYRLYRGADRITAVSRSVADAIVAQAPWTRPVVNVIPNPIDTAVFTAAPRDFNRPLRFLYAGRIHPEKGLEILIRAFALAAPRLPGATLAIMGAWEVAQGGAGPAYVERLRTLAGTAPVTFRDPVFDRTVFAAALRSCDIFVYPSIAEQGESFGVAPLEAMATGAVPVVSALACFSDFLEDGVTGAVFDHRSPKAADNLAGLLVRLATTPATLAKLSTAGAARALDFGTDLLADRHLADYAALLAS